MARGAGAYARVSSALVATQTRPWKTKWLLKHCVLGESTQNNFRERRNAGTAVLTWGPVLKFPRFEASGALAMAWVPERAMIE